MQEERFEEFAALIGGIHGNISKLKSSYTNRLGLKEVHMFWLYLLHVHPEGMSASELALSSKTNRSLVSREIAALLEQGILYTDGNTEHRRYGWKFKLTEKGNALAVEISHVAKNIQDRVNQGIGQEELAIFYKVLRILSDRFDQAIISENGGANNEYQNNQ